MKRIARLIRKCETSPENVRFAELCALCDHFFGQARQTGTSHRVYKTPWQGDPRINIQDDKGKAKRYQVRQVVQAIRKLEAEYGGKK
jgi:hypothetical protein